MEHMTVHGHIYKDNSCYEEIEGRNNRPRNKYTGIYKNLIIQEVEYSPAYDDKGRIMLTTIGEGKATYFIDGKITTENGKRHQEQIEQHITIIAEMRHNLMREHGFPLFLFQ